jgi:hypothetical protein
MRQSGVRSGIGLETALDLDFYTAIQQQQKMEQMTELLKAVQERMETYVLYPAK